MGFDLSSFRIHHAIFHFQKKINVHLGGQRIEMFKYILLILLWFLCGSIVYSPTQTARGVFGVRIAFQANSQFLTFVAFLQNDRTLNHKRILSQTEFINFASGHWPSIYNPKRINYFEERNLQCGIYTDTFSLKEATYCVPLDSLWKIRFSTYPIRGSSEEGWSSQMYNPSDKQDLFLFENYNVRSIDGDFFLDSNMWNLLSDVQDPVWIKNYKSLR